MMHLFDEAITEPVNRNNVLWIRRILFDLLTQPGDVVVDRARNRGAAVTPNFVEQLIACDNLTSMADEVAQDLKFASR